VDGAFNSILNKVKKV